MDFSPYRPGDGAASAPISPAKDDTAPSAEGDGLSISTPQPARPLRFWVEPEPSGLKRLWTWLAQIGWRRRRRSAGRRRAARRAEALKTQTDAARPLRFWVEPPPRPKRADPWVWLTGFGARRRQHKERLYWALREAEAMRMQHERRAEQVCDAILAEAGLPARRRRFMRLVRRQLARV